MRQSTSCGDFIPRVRRTCPFARPTSGISTIPASRKTTVEQGLAALEASQREIIAIIDIAGFSYAEAAGMLDIPIGTVMSRISRARTALAEIESSAVRPLKSNHGT